MDKIYNLLENKFLTYRDLCKATIQDDREPLVSLRNTGVKSFCFDKRMKEYTGDDIYIRQGLISRLYSAQSHLSKLLPGCVLEVLYGYRHPAVQAESYREAEERVLSEKPDGWTEETLKEAAHHSIAVPDVAGHPTGGAVDVRILDDQGIELDMGTAFHAFAKDSYVFSPYISKQAWSNRQKLRQCMLAAGFAPYDGEWWHFSYGDREWAIYYNEPYAIYDQIEFSIST